MTFHVALRDGAIVGCAAVSCAADVATLLALAVLPAYRDCGIGSHLVRTALTRARTHGCRHAALTTLDCAGYFGRQGFRMTPQCLTEDGVGNPTAPEFGYAGRYAMACELQ